MAIVHRISSGRHVLLSDHRQEAADAAAKLLENAGFETTAMQADVSDRNSIQAVIRKAQELGQIKALVQARADAKKAKDFAEADRIRDAVLEKGYIIEDTPKGPKVKKA